MISISTVEAATPGHVELDDGDSEFGRIPARASRTATLDGGCVITHYGVTDADRTFNINTVIDETQKTIIESIHVGAISAYLSCKDGFFLGTISTIDTSTPNFSMTFLVKERIA